MILTCPAIAKPGATPSVKAIRALRSLAARNRCACCTPTRCYPTPARAATEGRVCALEFDKFWFVDVYTPNAQNELARIDVRMAWDDAYRDFLNALERETGKPVVTCGDFNVAHEEIDLKNPKSNRGNAGFSDEERGKFTELLDAGFTDTWRAANPDVEGVYSWWSYRFNARKNNAGWRIDYFLVSDAIADNVRDTGIRGDIFGSDHCPVTLTLEL